MILRPAEDVNRVHAVTHVRERDSRSYWFSDSTAWTWFTSSAGRLRTTDSLMIRVNEDVILVHVLCWQWHCVTHSLTHSGQRSWFTFSNRTAEISAVLLTSVTSNSLEGQQHHLELDAGHNRQPAENIEGVTWENLGRFKTRCAAALCISCDSSVARGWESSQ